MAQHPASDTSDRASKIIGEAIRKQRRKRKWTQEELARRALVPLVTVNRAENGARMPDITTLMRLAAGLDCELTDLMPTKKLRPLIMSILLVAPITYPALPCNYTEAA